MPGSVKRWLASGTICRSTSGQACLSAQAAAGGVTGWVRNRNDGAVEAVFEGDPEAVDAMVRWCHSGPSGARVDTVDVTDEQPEGDRGFRVAGG